MNYNYRLIKVNYSNESSLCNIYAEFKLLDGTKKLWSFGSNLNEARVNLEKQVKQIIRKGHKHE